MSDHSSFADHSLDATEVNRYSRQLLIPEIGVGGQEALKNSKVLIVGAGGLGCPTAIYLASAGVDVPLSEIEATNLADPNLEKMETSSKDDHPIKTDSHSINLQVRYWPILEKYLDSNSSTPGDSPVDLETFGFSKLSPIPTEMERISMSGAISLPIVMDLVLKNIYTQHVTFRLSTWNHLKRVFEMACNAIETGLAEKAMEILLIVSKLDALEFSDQIDRFLKETPADTGYTDLMERASRVFNMALFEPYVIPGLEAMIHTKSLLLVEDDVQSAIKEFLMLPAIQSAFGKCLEVVCLSKDSEWIKKAIQIMKIWSKDSFKPFNGITVRGGIIIFTPIDLLQMNQATNKASIFTRACHETCHFLARLASDNFNFSSPHSACLPGDLVEKEKSLELGRHMEMLLFDGCQPDWPAPSEEAAVDFLHNAEAMEYLHGRIIMVNPDYKYYLVPRLQPSLSFAGDLEVDVIFLGGFE